MPTPAPAAPPARPIPGALRRQSTARTSPPALLLVALLLLAAPAEAVGSTGVGARASALQQAAVFGLLLVGMAQQVEGAGLNTVCNVAESCDACCIRLSLACAIPTTIPTTSTEMTQLTISGAGTPCNLDDAGNPKSIHIGTAGTPWMEADNAPWNPCYYSPSVAYTCAATPEYAKGRRFCACYACIPGSSTSSGSCVE